MTHKRRKITNEHSLRRKRILFKDEGVRDAVNNGGLTGSTSRLHQRFWRSTVCLIVPLMGNVVWVRVYISSVKGNVVVSLVLVLLAKETWERSLDLSTLQLFIKYLHTCLRERNMCVFLYVRARGRWHSWLPVAGLTHGPLTLCQQKMKCIDSKLWHNTADRFCLKTTVSAWLSWNAIFVSCKDKAWTLLVQIRRCRILC